MSAVTTANLTDILTGLGFDAKRLREARDGIDLMIDTFDVWRNPSAAMEGPVCGCITFREEAPETNTWLPADL